MMNYNFSLHEREIVRLLRSSQLATGMVKDLGVVSHNRFQPPAVFLCRPDMEPTFDHFLDLIFDREYTLQNHSSVAKGQWTRYRNETLAYNRKLATEQQNHDAEEGVLSSEYHRHHQRRIREAIMKKMGWSWATERGSALDRIPPVHYAFFLPIAGTPEMQGKWNKTIGLHLAQRIVPQTPWQVLENRVTGYCTVWCPADRQVFDILSWAWTENGNPDTCWLWRHSMKDPACMLDPQEGNDWNAAEALRRAGYQPDNDTDEEQKEGF